MTSYSDPHSTAGVKVFRRGRHVKDTFYVFVDSADAFHRWRRAQAGEPARLVPLSDCISGYGVSGGGAGVGGSAEYYTVHAIPPKQDGKKNDYVDKSYRPPTQKPEGPHMASRQELMAEFGTYRTEMVTRRILIEGTVDSGAFELEFSGGIPGVGGAAAQLPRDRTART